MKGYEDVVAGFMVLAAILVGGYFYLHNELFEQKKASQHIVVQKTESKPDLKTFEALSKRTE